MFIVGWGKNAKAVAYLGIGKCPNCRNYTHMYLYEVKKKISLMFVPVAKFDTHHFIVCSTCQAAAEIPPEKVDEVLRDSTLVPSQADYIDIWNSFMEVADDDHIDTEEQGLAAIEARASALKGQYSGDHVDKVLGVVAAYLSDDDKAA